MTRQAMEDALTAIEKTPKGEVYAARKGIVGAAKIEKRYIAFRRVGNGLLAESWPTSYTSGADDWMSVPADLLPRVEKMLDNL